MRAVVVTEPGGPEGLDVVDLEDPVAGPGEVVVDVVAAGVNRADVLQRQGSYPPPRGASDVLGLECSGIIASVGDGVTRWKVGDPVVALLSGGGYAEKVLVPAEQIAPLPEGLDPVLAGGIMEVAATVWSNVFMTASLQPGERLLVHGGASGIGTMAIQLAKANGAWVAVTAGSDDKMHACRELGADLAINYREADFVEVLRAATEGEGVDVILDNMGAAYLPRNVAALAYDGRLVVIGMQGGVKGELNLGALLAKRGSIGAYGLRGRPVAQKGEIVASLVDNVWPLFADETVRPVIHKVLPLADVRDAHRILDESSNVGKVVLTP
ncbi:NAD(P)H-quinone oxidoreductase [Mumia zhuanghuii]|uniref:NAD(P)H-quinone oxidoreductase n=2 Tax=Mumia TaxID=1546255 RepID=A0ABW1QNE1_9ACTN|nr:MULTISPECIES: NAD(P)H-quinone oxidoreductase [Mumia]KAA1424965.1 NAD(P)H-quinone oxidoreductase [Mumia zhuanghuii]